MSAIEVFNEMRLGLISPSVSGAELIYWLA